VLGSHLVLLGLDRVEVADRDVHAVLAVGPGEGRVLLGEQVERDDVERAEEEADPRDGLEGAHEAAASAEDVAGRRVGRVGAVVDAVVAEDRIRDGDTEEEEGEEGRDGEDRLGLERRRPQALGDGDEEELSKESDTRNQFSERRGRRELGGGFKSATHVEEGQDTEDDGRGVDLEVAGKDGVSPPDADRREDEEAEREDEGERARQAVGEVDAAAGGEVGPQEVLSAFEVVMGGV
jgi:hypothetical protein